MSFCWLLLYSKSKSLFKFRFGSDKMVKSWIIVGLCVTDQGHGWRNCTDKFYGKCRLYGHNYENCDGKELPWKICIVWERAPLSSGMNSIQGNKLAWSRWEAESGMLFANVISFASWRWKRNIPPKRLCISTSTTIISPYWSFQFMSVA
jgi:hypothetical protein